MWECRIACVSNFPRDGLGTVPSPQMEGTRVAILRHVVGQTASE